jgi:hypothetical protein
MNYYPPRSLIEQMSPMEIILSNIEYLHGKAYQARNSTEANRYMKGARRGSKRAAPFLTDIEFRQRLLSDQPMSQGEWQEYKRGPAWPPFITII